MQAKVQEAVPAVMATVMAVLQAVTSRAAGRRMQRCRLPSIISIQGAIRKQSIF